MYKQSGKRILDLIVAIPVFIILLPIFFLIAVSCAIAFDGNIIFTQVRCGRNEKPFEIYKFISMLPQNAEQSLSDSERLTKFGNWLRRNSLDEIPQLLNVIKGDMSIIGPRPLFMHYLPYYREQEKTRHTVRPGITGLAQIKGRNLLDWDSRLAYDIDYVNHLTLFNDIKIALLTIKVMLTRSGAVADQRLVMQDLDAERSGNHLQ